MVSVFNLLCDYEDRQVSCCQKLDKNEYCVTETILRKERPPTQTVYAAVATYIYQMNGSEYIGRFCIAIFSWLSNSILKF